MIRRNLIKCLVLMSFTFMVCELNGQCNHQDDYTALRALYLATDGDSWDDKTGWPNATTFVDNPTPPAGTDMSAWYGIKCLNNRVDCLDLDGDADDCEPSGSSGNGVAGYLPEEIVGLTELRAISLQNMDMEFPEFITGMISLEVIGLDGDITGSIPSSIGNLQNLKEIDMSGELTGPIPSEVGLLINLEEFKFLFTNNLSGEIPSEFGNLLKLRRLRLDGNLLTGSIPPEIANLPNLNYLNFRDNDLEGCIDPNFMNLCYGIVNLDENGKLPWAGNFYSFCDNYGSIEAQIGSPCDDGDNSNGTNDVIREDCSCGEMIVSTSEITKEISIFPNPTESHLYIKGIDAGIWEYEMVNMDGRILQYGVLRNDFIDLSKIEMGMYLLRLKELGGEVVLLKKVMKK